MFGKNSKILQSLSTILKTYRLGLVQTKAYRALKQHTSEQLIEYDLTSVEWAFLGMLYDNPEGLKSSEAALELGVEAPFITQIRERMHKKKLIELIIGTQDKRERLLKLSKEGTRLVPEIESHLRSKSKVLIEGLSPLEIFTYQKVLQTIVDNYNKNKIKA